MKKTFLLSLAVAVLTCAAAHAETYYWRVTDAGSWVFDWTNHWTSVTPAYSNSWPHEPADVAVVMPANSCTNIYGNFQAWLNITHPVDILGSLINVGSNSFLYTANTGVLLFDNTGSVSRIIHTNLAPVDASGELSSLPVYFFQDTAIVLSNDLEIANYCVENPSNVVEYTDFLFTDTIVVDCNGYSIIKNGPGWFYPGDFGDGVRILNGAMIELNGCVTYVFDSNTIEPPMYVNSFIDCRNYWQSSQLNLAGGLFLTDIVVSNQSYLFTPYSNWMNREMRGDLTVLGMGLMYPYWPPDGRIWTNDFTGDINGDGDLYTGFSAVRSGLTRFTGSISPGVGGAGSRAVLYMISFTNAGVEVGTKTDSVDLNIDVDGLRNWVGKDADALAVYGLAGSSVPLDTIDLNVNVNGNSNPYLTNQIMYSSAGAFNGSFNSVTWSDPGRVGELILSPTDVYLTGVPPLSNFFDVQPYRLMFVQGETQDVLTARSPFELDVAISNLADWITVQSSVSLSNDVAMTVPVTVPFDQPVTNGFGLSYGTVRLVNSDDTNVAYDVDVYVTKPGYFELTTTEAFMFLEQDNRVSVQVYSPQTVTVNANVTHGGSWLTASPSSVSLTNDGEYVRIDGTAQPAGTTGTVTFTNADDPSITHDVAIKVVSNGYFEVSPDVLTFELGETQKFLDVFCPFKANVLFDVPTNATWLSTISRLELAYNGYYVPVDVPLGQPASTTTITLVNECVTDIVRKVQVIVIGVQPGDFTVDPLAVEFVTGETQKFVTVASATNATVSIAALPGGEWITVPPSVAVLCGSTNVPIVIPSNQPDGSTGTVRFTSVEKPSLSHDVVVTVVPEAGLVVLSLLIGGFWALKRRMGL